ncbi:MAG: SecD/SecF family protein translocase subunit [Acidimicrobiia bacterium]|nr:SecD/SecF family protein translocase subunit [Acidimicrobiia bacterium]
MGDPRRQIAIVLDGQIIASPQVAEDVAAGVGITGGDAIITLGADPAAEDQAQNLAVILRYGSLPVAFERSQVEKVSATLGSDSLRIGLISGIAGLVLVAVVLLLYYRSLGLVAVLGIAVFGSLLIAIYALLGHYQGVTLTLAGVTGIIVAVGITADSYIVYFERIKDELRAGRTVPSAAAQGFRTAFRTILTADTVSILGATLLWLLTVGAVRGFALSLGIATVLDIFVARAFTRRAAWVLAHSPLGRKGWFSMPAAAGESR